MHLTKGMLLMLSKAMLSWAAVCSCMMLVIMLEINKTIKGQVGVPALGKMALNMTAIGIRMSDMVMEFLLCQMDLNLKDNLPMILNMVMEN
jgi:hypothetical protein